MTHFDSGPAQGKALFLKRTPRLLRVVECAGKFDALDQLDDVASPDETIHVYRLIAVGGRTHIYGKRISGWYTHATYTLHNPQPEDSLIRDNDRWRAWTRDLAEKYPALFRIPGID